MSNLRAELDQIAANFVSSLLRAMQDAPLSELVVEAGEAQPVRGSAKVGKPGTVTEKVTKVPGKKRRHRSSAKEVQRQKDVALAAAKSLKGGFAKSDVMKKSGSKVDLGRALSLLVLDRKLTRKGDRRKARYWAKP
jgi:hypothetical protein